MNKQEFLSQLRERLTGLPEPEREERLDFYSEMINDRRGEGVSEEMAVTGLGTVDEIAAQILEETPLTKLVRERIRPKRKLRAWEILLLTLGSPVWLPLLLASAAVVISCYAVIWSLVAALWAVFAALAAGAPGGLATGILFAARGSAPAGLAMLGGGLACAGLAVLFFIACLAVTKGILHLTKKLAVSVKHRFEKKEAAV